MGSTVLTRPSRGAWLDVLDLDPLIVISPEAVALVELGLADHSSVIDLDRFRASRSPSTPVRGPVDPASPPGSAGPLPSRRVVGTLTSTTSQATSRSH